MYKLVGGYVNLSTFICEAKLQIILEIHSFFINYFFNHLTYRKIKCRGIKGVFAKGCEDTSLTFFVKIFGSYGNKSYLCNR